MSKTIRNFKILLVATGIYVLLMIAAWIFFPKFLLEATDEGGVLAIVLGIINFAYIGVFLAFLWYFYKTAKILFAYRLIRMSPLTLTIIQAILTPITLALIIPVFILPVRLWLKIKHLPQDADAAPLPESKPGDKKSPKKIIGGVLLIVSILIELWMITAGLLVTLWAYDVQKDISILAGYLIGHIFFIGLGIFGYRLGRR